MAEKLPYESQVEDVLLVNFAGSRMISLLGQMIELSFYESVFEPLQRAKLLLYDPISLFNNFPMIGEELVLVKVRETNSRNTKTYSFVIDSVEDIIPSDKGREVNLSINLVSLAGLANARQSVMRAYNGKIHNVFMDMMDQYVSQSLVRLSSRSGGIAYALAESLGRDTRVNPANVETSLGGDEGTICIPNMRPMQAGQWLAARCVPESWQRNYTYMFWQGDDGFHFETIQRKMSSQITGLKRFKYYSDSTIVKRLTEDQQRLAITNLVFNNRIKTLDRIASGYHESALFEINMQQLRYKTANTGLEDYATTSQGFGGRLNTLLYSEAMKIDNLLNGTLESKNRVKYIFNNRMDNDPITPLTNAELRWGNDARSETAFGSIDMHITVYGDTTIRAGDVIELELPRMEGFNAGDGNSDDKLITGRYLVTDVKHQYALTQHGSTVMRINKDDFTTVPEAVPYNYGDVGTEPNLGSSGAAS